MANVPGVNGNTFDVHIAVEEQSCYVMVGDQLITDNVSEVRLFLMAYKMGRDHKKAEIRAALGA